MLFQKSRVPEAEHKKLGGILQSEFYDFYYCTKVTQFQFLPIKKHILEFVDVFL